MHAQKKPLSSKLLAGFGRQKMLRIFKILNREENVCKIKSSEKRRHISYLQRH